MTFQKGSFYSHKLNCSCFRCAGKAWNKGLKRWWSSPTEFKKGKHYSRETEFKRKGVRLGYHGLHDWVYARLGYPKSCVHCGKTENLEWANKSFKYKKRKNDWISLCRKCHRQYDFNNGWGKATQKYPELRRVVMVA